MSTWERSGKPCSLSDLRALTVKRRWQGVCVHHSWRPTERDYERLGGERTVAAIKRAHEEKGWVDIGYHLLIGPDGRLFWGRSFEHDGAHAVRERPEAPPIQPNKVLLGICLIGNFDASQPSAEQLNALRDVLHVLSAKFGFGPEDIYFHRQFQYKTCPGTKLELSTVRAMLSSGAAQLKPTPIASAQIEGTVRVVLADRGPIGEGVLIGGRVFLPVRALAEELGLQVLWDEQSRTVTLRRSVK